jgi:N-acetylglucosaminyldiphosphoundecaprenol N-acetyl-beta-D-mannosaminyltransferase
MATETVEKIDLFGISFDNVDFDGLCEAMGSRVESRTPGYIVTPNVDHVVNRNRETELRPVYDDAWMCLADGAPVMWAARWLGRPLKEKLSGSDLLPRLAGWAAERKYSFFLLGAADGVAEAAAKRLDADYPGLRIAGTYAPPLGFETDAEENARAVDRVREASADICFVALGSPKQEVWMRENISMCETPVMIGVGAAFNFVSGTVRRAPRWMQRCGLEWVFRLLQEPAHLWRRYLLKDPYFLVLVARELAQHRLNQKQAP